MSITKCDLFLDPLVEAIVFSNTTQTPDPHRNAPRTLVYDPGRHIHDPARQIAPFSPVIEFCYEENKLKTEVENAQNNQLFLILIFPNKSDTEVRLFLMKYIPSQDHLHSLYIIFPNGVQFHDKLVNIDSMTKLRWCRSFTTQLIRDICNVCESSCNANIEFYQQRIIIAEDAIDRNTIDSANSIVILFAEEMNKFSLLLENYQLIKAESKPND